MPAFKVTSAATRGRLGKIDFERPILTPYLFPVAFMMTGTTARGGATWKYVLQADQKHGLLRRNLPVLTQVLHFLDYKVSPNSLNTWRKESIRGLYNQQIENLNYRAPIFLDSGGFKLMWRTGLDLSPYGLSLEPEKEAKSILALQRDLGGDLVATLDYPLPPGLLPDETNERMLRSRNNAIKAARLLREDPEFANYQPFLYLAVHGLTPESISTYVSALFEEIKENDLGGSNIGLAIGSLVPLRMSRNSGLILELVRSAKEAIPLEYRERVPIHVFGVTGLLVPFLAYCGVDTYDSSTFAQEVRNLNYLLPSSFQRRSVLEMTQADITCECRVCQELDLHEMQESLVSDVVGKPLPNGHYKSKYYADIALHNLELDLGILDRTRDAIKSSELNEYLVEITRSVPRLKSTFEALANEDNDLAAKAERFIINAPDKKVLTTEPSPFISLSFTPDDFNINANGYHPIGDKRVLLIVPCSRQKPYSASQSHKYLSNKLNEIAPQWVESVDKVTLSGLYGPIPLKFEMDEAILHYDFRLTTNNSIQIDLCVERLVEFLERHGEYYRHCLAYATSNAYRTVLERAARQYSRLIITPKSPKSRTLREFFRESNIQELTSTIQAALVAESRGDMEQREDG